MCYDRMGQTNEERGRRRMASERLNVTDVCDVVEFHESADGVALYGQEGRWTLSAQRGGKRNGLCHALEAGRHVSAAEGARRERRGAGGRICGGIWRAGARPSDGAAGTTSANTAPTGRSGSATRRTRPRWITLRRARSWRRGWAIPLRRLPWRAITAACRTGATRRTTAAERCVLG